MIQTKIDLKIDPVVLQLEKYILEGADSGAKLVAETLASATKNILSSKISANKGQSSGNLASAISVLNASPGIKGYSRWDVFVDTSVAPYAYWIEDGSSTSVGLPYSVSGSRDYSKSDFKGHKYLKEAIDFMSSDNNAGVLVASEIVKRLKGLSPSELRSLDNG